MKEKVVQNLTIPTTSSSAFREYTMNTKPTIRMLNPIFPMGIVAFQARVPKVK